MHELIGYCLAAFLPSFVLRLAAAFLPVRLQWLRWLALTWPAGLLVLSALALGADPGFFIGWNAFVAGWLAILAGLALAGFGLGAGLGRLIQKRSI